MNEPSARSKIDPSFWLSVFFVIVIAVGVVTAGAWRWDTRLFPWAVGVPALILALWQLATDARGGRARSPAEAKATEAAGDLSVDSTIPAEIVRKRTLRAIAWIAVFMAGIWLGGFLIAIPFFVALYLFYEARAGLVTAILLAGCTEIFVWGIFDWLMNIAWPEAALSALLR